MTKSNAFFTIYNIVAASLLVAGWQLGYIQQVLAGDISRLSYVMAALAFLTFIRMCWDTAQRPSHITLQPTFHYVEYVEVWLVTLGLIANCVGFILALKGFDEGSLATAEGAQTAGAALLAGMGTAFYGTITGAVTALWLAVGRRIVS